jgi:GGDEF domain-containing protein
VPAELAAAEAVHEPLALVCVRLDHYRDLRDFRGREGSEAVVRTVARRLKRTLGPDDLAFRLAPDLLVVTLRGRDARTVRGWTEEAAHEVTGQLIERHRQTLSFGCAAYPPLHDARALLDDALAALAAPAATELVIARAAAAVGDELTLAVAT